MLHNSSQLQQPVKKWWYKLNLEIHMMFIFWCRLTALQTSGEESWKKRISKDVDAEKLQQLVGEVKLRDKSKLRGGGGDQRPVSLAERLSYLDEAQEGWKERVGEKDVRQFTLDEKMAKKGNFKKKAHGGKIWNCLKICKHAFFPVMYKTTHNS